MHDVIVRGGEVIDGTGSTRRRADVAIDGDRITAIGDLGASAAQQEIDASGRLVTPGFVDVHTHLDAQAFWDTTLSPSPLHGVTTAIAGNCGFSIAPLGTDPEDGEYLMKMLSRVEGLPLETLREGVPWDWDTTAEYLDALDGRLSINTAFAVGHSAIRRVVMGSDATRRAARDDEVAAMCRLLRDGIEAGGVGLSSSWSSTHNDTEQNMVPSRYSDRAELMALCSVLDDYRGMSIEFISGVGPFPDHIVELMGDMSVAASAPLNWNVLAVDHKNLDECIEKLDMSLSAQARGGRVVGLTAPMTLDFRLNFASGFLLDSVPGWEEAMLLPLPDKRALFADPDERARLGELALARHPLRKFTHWARMVVFHAVAPENRDYVGRSIGEIAEELGKSPWDTICDIALADDLQTSFGHPTVDEPLETWEARVRVWRHPAAVIGASDAGAHLDMFVSANYTTTVLGEAVARRSLLSMEEAVHLLTQVPADLYGLTDRGTLAEGNYADLVVLDERSVSSNPMVTRTDLPGGASRLYADANGIDHVLCNGVEIVRNGGFTASRPGVVLRSGTHTG